MGYLFNDKYNLYLQYNTILGDRAGVSAARYNDDSRVDIPNTLYKVDRLTLGVNMYF